MTGVCHLFFSYLHIISSLQKHIGDNPSCQIQERADERFLLERAIRCQKKCLNEAVEFVDAVQVFAGVHSITHGLGSFGSFTKYLLWNVVRMGSGAAMGEGATLCGQDPIAKAKETWHRLKSLHAWLSRTSDTEQQYTTGNRAEAKLSGDCRRTAARGQKQEDAAGPLPVIAPTPHVETD